MHYRMLVTLNKEEAATSEGARRYVEQELLNDPSFIGGGRFGEAMADWFVIGGRWSGELSRHSWAKSVQEEINALQQAEDIQVRGAHYGDPDKQQRQKTLSQQVEALYARAIPQAYRAAGLGYARDTYLERGYADDAMVVTAELYEALLATLEGEWLVEDGFVVAFVDLDYDPVRREFVDSKWLVVVDAHI